MISLVGLAAVVFASTNIDDLCVLLGSLADPTFRARDVVIGQYVGIGALFGVSVVASLVSLVVPKAYVGLLGLAPILLGCKKLYDVTHGREPMVENLERHADAGAHIRAFTVAAVTIANGGDNIGVYTPLFATKSDYELALIGAVFAAMTAAWCVIAKMDGQAPDIGRTNPSLWPPHRALRVDWVGRADPLPGGQSRSAASLDASGCRLLAKTDSLST